MTIEQAIATGVLYVLQGIACAVAITAFFLPFFSVLWFAWRFLK